MSMVEVELTSGQRPLQYNVSQPHYSTCVPSMRMCVYTLKCRQRLYHQDHSQTEAFECTSKTHTYIYISMSVVLRVIEQIMCTQ